MAATIIDALLVTLGLDTTGFKKGQAEADEALKKTKDNTVQNAKEITAKAKQATDGFIGMRKELLKIVGIFVSANGIKSFVERITTSDAAVGRLADNLGMATEELSAWQKMSSKFGGSAEDTDSFFRNIYKISQELKLFGSSAALLPLGRLLGPEGLAKFADNATTIAEKAKILQAAVAGASSRQDALSLMQQAGFTEQTVTVMREIGNGLERQLQLQRELNAATERDKKLAIERAAAWDRFTDSLERAGRAMLNSPLMNMTEGLNAAAAQVTKWNNKPATVLEDAWKWIKDNALSAQGPSASGDVVTWLLDKLRDAGIPDYKKKGKAKSAAAPASGAVAGDWRDATQLGRDNEAARIIQTELDAERNPETRAALQRELDRIRSGNMLSNGASSAARTLGRASSARPAAATQKVDVSIGTLQVNTQATDARGIARDIGGALRANYSLATQANFGTE